jgi:hypothetical protein
MIEEGAMVRERQTIIRLPDLSQMQVKCTVHESKIDSLRRGMRARIKVQDRESQGIVTSVSNQPEPSNWFSGSVREYAAIVAIETNSGGLRPGMTSAVEILIANLEDVLSVPVQALVEKKGKFYCWVKVPEGIEKREIELGLGNNTRMQVTSGLQEGELVLLSPRDNVAEASDDERDAESVNVKERFGGDKPADLPRLPTSSKGQGAEQGKQAGRGGFNLMSLDTDGDKKISLEEAPAQMKDRFGDVDTNSDGFLDSAEIAALRRKVQQGRQGGGPGGPEAPRGP